VNRISGEQDIRRAGQKTKSLAWNGWSLIVPSWSDGRCEKILNKCAKLKRKIILEKGKI